MSKGLWLAGIFILLMHSTKLGQAQTPNVDIFQEKQQIMNQITVSLVVSGIRLTCARFAEDIRNVVNDISPRGVRVLPILGVGGIQNIQDLLFLRGIDMGTVDQDHIEYLQAPDPVLYADLDQRINYITKLYNSEFHIAARAEFTSISDLHGRRVSFNLENSHSHVAAERLFSMMGLQTETYFFDDDSALQLLQAGELDAHIVLTGAPQSGLSSLSASNGIHFLPLSETDFPAINREKLFRYYLPADLTHEHYPQLIARGQAIPTIATRTALAVYNWEEGSYRYRKIERFIEKFFSKIEAFNDRSRHPKWTEVNLAAQIPGWKRFKPAQDWLDRHRDKNRRRAYLGSDGTYVHKFGGKLTAGSEVPLPVERRKNVAADRLEAQFRKFLRSRATEVE